ncbi:MAG: MBOAT family O-acyltransferase [Angelakisella sp.]
MVFSSLTFLFLFFPLVMGVYYLCPRALRNLWLLLTSLLFYAWGEPVYIRLMAASILFNYLCGLGVATLQKREKKRLAKGLLILCIAGNIGALGLFKYADLLIGTVNNIAGSKIALLELALPIGISFYTFQALSYVIDVYRGTVAAQKNPITFGTYIALFPQLIAGPIVQYKTVEEQLSHRRETTAQFAAGIGRFTIGLGKKVLIANQVGALWDTVAALPGTSLSAGTAWLGAIAFTFQIYFDFSGYSDMAIGLGKMLGFEFLENFNYPYLSRSITEYWRRWHISLGTWFREYVYIPLGGNRCGLPRQILNLIIVWGLTGLWHGASWNFLLWGLYYGVILIIEKVWLQKPLQKAPGVVQRLYSLLLIVLGWVIFALTDFGAIGNYFAALFGAHGGADAQTMYLLTTNISLLLVAALACTRWPAHAANDLLARLPRAAQTLLRCLFYAAVLLMCVAFLVGDSYNPFLYFRF